MSQPHSAAGFLAALLALGTGEAAELTGLGPERKTIVAGERYEKGGFYRFLFGADYRDLWTTPVSLPVLDLKAFAGGLTPTRIVGHGQSKALALRGADGRSYTFRPLLKDPSGLLPAELRESKAKDFVQDQMASGHPAGHVIVPPLMEAVGLLHNEPRLAIMPDDPALGEFRQQFAGVAGDIEEYTGSPGFGGTVEVINGEEMWKRLRANPDVRADSRAYLKARLIDQLIGDWDRHRNQWSWARVTGQERWQPIPEDRDQAFVRFEGAALGSIRPTLPLLVKFGKDYSDLEGLAFDGWDVDKRLLADLEKPTWDEVAREVKAALTDEVLQGAVGRMPPEYHALDGARLLAGLKARRDRIEEQADRFYRFINGTVDVFGTDQSEEVAAVRDASGDLEVTVRAAGAESKPYFRRRFRKGETRDVHIYLFGGNDRVVTTGGRQDGVVLRVIGSGGQDVLDDSQGGGTRFSSSDDDDRVEPGPGTSWDRRHYEPPPRGASGEWIPPRDWGRRTIPAFRITYEPDLGVMLNAGLQTTRYGFRQHPYSDRQTFKVTYAAQETAFRGLYDGDFRFENSPRRVGVLALASGLEVQRFFGFGNETAIEGDPDLYKVEQRQYALAPTLGWSLGPRADLRLGLIGKYADTQEGTNPVLGGASIYGEGRFGQVGAVTALEIETMEDIAFPERGLRFTLAGLLYPSVWDVESTFGKAYADAKLFLSPSGSWRPTLVLGAGGQMVFGDAPYFESAFLGGRARLGRYEPGGQGAVRGLRPQRYAGDGSVYGTADLFLPLTRASFLGIPLQFGVMGLGDAGRVYLDGESSDMWHTSYGGGLFFASPGRRNLFVFSLARSEGRTSFYMKAGLGL